MGNKDKHKEHSNAGAMGEEAESAHDATKPAGTSAEGGPLPWTSWSWML